MIMNTFTNISIRSVSSVTCARISPITGLSERNGINFLVLTRWFNLYNFCKSHDLKHK